MPADFPIARFFLMGGLALAVAGLVLGWALPIALPLPPYLFTAVLALLYGVFCWRKSGSAAAVSPTAQKEEARE